MIRFLIGIQETSDGDPFISRKRILIHISSGLILHYFFNKTSLSVLKISITLFFLKNVLWTRSVFKDPLWKRILVHISCPCPDVLKKKTKVSDIFVKNNKESSPLEIWIKIRFFQIHGSPSLEETATDLNIYSVSLHI